MPQALLFVFLLLGSNVVFSEVEKGHEKEKASKRVSEKGTKRPVDPNFITIDQLIAGADKPTPEYYLLLFRWIEKNTQTDKLRCKTVERKGSERWFSSYTDNKHQELFSKLKLISEDQLSAAGPKFAEVLAKHYSRKELFRLYTETSYKFTTHHCLGKLLRSVFDHFPAKRAATELQHFMGIVFKNPMKDFVFDGNVHQYSLKETKDIARDDRFRRSHLFLREMLKRIPPAQMQKHIPEAVRKKWAHESNVSDNHSRYEIIDILSSDLGSGPKGHPTGSFHLSMTSLKPVEKNAIARAYLSHAFDPKKFPPKVFVASDNPKYRDKHDDNTLHIFCSSGDFKIDSGKKLLEEISYTPMIGHLTINATLLNTIQLKKQKVVLDCGGVKYELKASKTRQEGTVFENPKDFTFKPNEKNEIKVVATVGLVEEISPELLQLMLGKLKLLGFKLETEKPVPIKKGELKKQFLEQAKDSQIYFPIVDGMDLSSFIIGQEGGSKLVMEFKPPGAKSKLKWVLFIPPTKKGKFEQVKLFDTEISQLFRDRRKAKMPNWFVMNLACDSDRCIKGWMNGFFRSYDDQKLPKRVTDVPVIVGAKRGFEVSEDKLKEAHMKHPLVVSMIAARHGSIKDVLKALENTYKPASNTQVEGYFDPSQSPVSISLKGSNGHRVIYDLAN